MVKAFMVKKYSIISKGLIDKLKLHKKEQKLYINHNNKPWEN